ncbi:hypothetical protein RZE82_06440 [Mollicutes bacterium LVI A0039]|nr:hypothetical protein RZE82_06440 [Mollicutes bacterium LVI A0039]
MVRNGFISNDGLISRSGMLFSIKFFFFFFGIIILNIMIVKNKLKLGVIFLVALICGGILCSNITYNVYIDQKSNFDWFSDGIK